MQVNAETGRPQGSGAESQTDAGAGAGGSKESNAESHVGPQPQTGAGAGANGSETQSCVDDGTSRPLGSGTQPQTSATACGGGFGGSNPHSHVDASASGLQGPSASIDTQYTPQAPPGVGAQQHSSNQAQIGAESIGSQGSSTNAHSQSAQSGLSDNPGIAATRSQAYAGAGAGGSYGSGVAISSQPLDSASIGQVASTTQQKAGGGANGLGESTLTGSPQPGRSGMPSDHLTSIQQQAAGAGAGSGASGPYQSMLTASSPAENSGASNGNTASSIVYQASANVSGSQGSILTSDPQLEHDISQGVSGQAASSTMPLASPYAGGSQRSAFTTALSATGLLVKHLLQCQSREIEVDFLQQLLVLIHNRDMIPAAYTSARAPLQLSYLLVLVQIARKDRASPQACNQSKVLPSHLTFTIILLFCCRLDLWRVDFKFRQLLSTVNRHKSLVRRPNTRCVLPRMRLKNRFLLTALYQGIRPIRLVLALRNPS